MITKNIDGNNISAGFIAQIRSDSPDVTARLWYDNAALSCDIVNITVEKGSCGQQTFMVGDVIGDMLTATVKNLSTDIKEEVIECHIGALVNGSYEYISLGRFRVSEVKKTRYQAEITAYSSIVADTGTRLDTTGLSNPTIAQIAAKVAGKLNCTVSFDAGIDTSLQVGAQLNGLTYYEALQVIAICCGGYVVNTYDGNIAVKKFDATTTLAVDTGMMVKLPEFAEQPYSVDSIGVMVSEATTDNNGAEIFYSYNPTYIVVTKQGTDYYLKDENDEYILANLKPDSADVYFSCAYMTEAIFSTNVLDIRGYTYSPATVGLTLGDPRLEGCDVLAVTDVDGDVYTVPCHRLIHKYDGGFTTEITSCEASDKANSIGTSLPITQRLETQARQIGTAQATADNAYKVAGDTNQYFWFTGSGSDTGAHITETPQTQFLADPTNGGGNLLARSNGVAIRDGLTELAEFTESGVNINSNGVSVAKFGTDEARIGAEGGSYVDLTTDGLEVYQDGDLSASFGSTRAQIGKDSTGHAVITDSGMTIYANDGTVELANLGYGKGNAQSGTAQAPYYTLGHRILSSVHPAGNYSFVEGGGNSAEGFASHAEGMSNQATDRFAHAEGYQTVASNDGSHAEGWHTTASGSSSHAEGSSTIASGDCSHAEGEGAIASGDYSHAEGASNAIGNYSHASGLETIAAGSCQMVIGKRNVSDETSLFIIGNGTSSRSNALKVDSNGNVRIKGNLYTGCDANSSNGTLMTLLKVTKSSVSSLSTTITNSNITSNMEVVNCVLSNPSAQTGDWTVTTASGSLTISGSISGTTNITLYLAVPVT